MVKVGDTDLEVQRATRKPPMAFVFLVMMPMMIGSKFATADLDQAALWHGELWFAERTRTLSFRDPQPSAPALALRHVRLTDLSDSGPQVSVGVTPTDSTTALLATGDRLWVIQRAFSTPGHTFRSCFSGFSSAPRYGACSSSPPIVISRAASARPRVSG